MQQILSKNLNGNKKDKFENTSSVTNEKGKYKEIEKQIEKENEIEAQKTRILLENLIVDDNEKNINNNPNNNQIEKENNLQMLDIEVP